MINIYTFITNMLMNMNTRENVLKPAYPMSIECVEQGNQNNGEEKKEDGKTKQT